MKFIGYTEKKLLKKVFGHGPYFSTLYIHFKRVFCRKDERVPLYSAKILQLDISVLFV